MNLQEDCSDDEVDPEVEPPPLPDQPTVGQILHIDQEDALRFTGSLMNEFTRKIIQVFILKFIIGQVSTAGSIPLNRKIGHPLRKMTNPPKKQHNHFEKLRICRSSFFRWFKFTLKPPI